MTVRTCAAATASLLGAVWGCGTTNETPATVNAVTPNMAFNDAATSVQIAGTDFRPAFRFDTMGGAASSEAAGFSVMLVSAPSTEPAAAVSVALEGVAWQSKIELAATIPAAVPAGAYDVVVVDPRGGERRLPGGFTSLGPDEQRPTVTIDTPGPRSLIGGGATITVQLTADDGLGFVASLTATVTHDGVAQSFPCDLPRTPGLVTCQFEFTAPAPLNDMDTVAIEATASDRAGNDAVPALRRSPLVRRPSLTSVSPTVGPAGGGTKIEVRGRNFVKPTPDFDGSFLLISGQPVDAEVVNDTTITAATPPHDGVVAWLAVSNGGAESNQMPFEFIESLQLRGLAPDRGPVTGGTPVAIVGNGFRGLKTIITFDGNQLVCPDPVSATRIEGVIPPGRGPGPVFVIASDEHGRSNMLIFTYLEADMPDGGVEPPICKQGPS